MTFAATQPMRLDVEPRGTLTVRERAAARLASGVLAEALPALPAPKVDVASLDDAGIELRATLTLEYPTEPVSSILVELRQRVVADVERQLGRPVRRLDLVVESFQLERPAPARRVT